MPRTPSSSGPRSAWRAAVVVLVLFARAQAALVEGYPTETSVRQGGTLELHVRCEQASYNVSIWQQRTTLEHVANVGVFPGSNFPVPDPAWEDCHWPVSCRITVPSSWRPGAYVARLDVVDGYAWVPFVVRSPQPGSFGPILVQLSINTWQAYNRYGGKSLYGAYRPDLVGKADRVSFHRPYNHYDPAGSGQFFVWEANFISFLESKQYDYEVCTNVDLHREPGLLEHYRLFCSVGHDEYYTKEMFDALERFVDGGGNLAFFSANTLWWQARLEDGEHTLVCYKDPARDPLLWIDPSRVTTNWHANPVLRPPARLMGIYYNGSNGIPTGGYQVVDPHSWVFRGVHVDPGQMFGAPMVGFEVDSRAPDSPPTLDVIARIELPDHNNGDVLRPCEMVYYERTPAYGFSNPHGGKVFSCGSVMYMYGLVPAYNSWVKVWGQADPVAQALTVNVLDRLGGSVSPPQPWAPVDSQLVRGTQVLLSWRKARAQRAAAPVHYTVFCQDAAGHADSVETDWTSGWMPVKAARSPYRWWVRAASEWGQSATSAARTFVAVPADAGPPPTLSLVRQPDRITILVWSENAARGEVELFDVRGHRLRRFERAFEPGLTEVEWDLRNDSGRAVASGIYVVRLEAGPLHARRKLAVVR